MGRFPSQRLLPRRLAAALAVGALFAQPQVARPESLDTAAERAARACKENDLDAAAEALRELERGLEAEYGAGNDSAIGVRLTLARVESARGNAAEARALAEVPTGRAAEARVDAKLKRTLRKLRSCGIGSEPRRAHPAQLSFEEHLTAAEKLVNRGRYRMAFEAAERAAEAARSGAEASARMRLHVVRAAIFAQRGLLARAMLEAAAADQLARERGAVGVRIQLARLLARAGDLERASDTLAELAPSAKTVQERADLDEALGDLALLLGSPREASEHLERAREGHRKAGAGPNAMAAVLQLQGEAYRLAGEFPAATSAYREALRLRQTAAVHNQREAAMTHNGFGVLQADMGDFRAADAEYAAALAILREAEGEDHPDIVAVRLNRALARWRSARSSAAAEEYAAAVDSLGRTLGEDHPSVTAATRNLAHIELERGRVQSAAALLERLLQTIDAGHPDFAAVRLARGRLRLGQGRPAEAGADFDAAIAVLTSTRGAAHPLVAQAHTLRARAAVAEGDDATAFREASAAAHAIDVHLRRTFGAISDRQRVVLAEASRDAVGALLSVQSAPPRELFLALLPHRDTVLRSIAARRAAGGEGGARERELDALRARYVAAALGRGPDAARRVAELSKQIEALEQRVGDSAAARARAVPEQVLERACAKLAADDALVKFVAYERTRAEEPGRTTPAYAALVLRGGDCAVRRIELEDAGRIEKQADVFADAMRARQSDAHGARAELSRLLLGPLGEATRGTRRWLVVPDGSLWGVPIGALPDPDAPDRYLLERVTVGYLTSTHELAEAATSRSHSGASLLIGAPDFGEGQGGPVVLTPTGPCEMPPFEKLPGTRAEIAEIEQLVEGSRVLSGRDATKARLAQELARKPWLIHFATHAYFAGRGCQTGTARERSELSDGAQPLAPNPLLLSGIVLAGANRSARVDAEATSGVITAYEVAGLDLTSAGLVVLSACDTGTGLHLRGQEVQGLRWGFRAAGANALVSSLWQSNDLATRRMMHTFYESLATDAGETDPFRGAEALRRAQLAQIEKEKRLGVARPRDWANFIFSGVL